MKGRISPIRPFHKGVGCETTLCIEHQTDLYRSRTERNTEFCQMNDLAILHQLRFGTRIISELRRPPELPRDDSNRYTRHRQC